MSILGLLGLASSAGGALKAVVDIGTKIADLYEKKQIVQTERERLLIDQEIRALEIMRDTMAQRSAERQTAMTFPVFWVAWLPPALAWGLWFALGMLDSSGLEIIAVHELPPQLKEYADAISISLYGSGAVVGTAQTISAAIRSRQVTRS